MKIEIKIVSKTSLSNIENIRFVLELALTDVYSKFVSNFWLSLG